VVSFNLGGEKLKSSRFYFRVLFLVLLLITGFFSIVTPSFAQTSPDLSAQSQNPNAFPLTGGVDESTIIFDDAPDTEVPNGGSSLLLMLRMLLVLGLAALAIYGVVFFIKRISRPRENPDPHLKVLARVPLASDSFAAVISLGAKAWLVGGGSGGVNLISEVEDAESLETLLLEDAKKNAESRRFLDFRSLLRFGRDEKNLSLQGSTFTEKLRKQRERLKGL
jgi:flagellar protein FliO/FliZ